MSEIIVLDTHIWFWFVIIIATALEYKAKLASMDGIFFKYPELNDCLMKKG